MSRQHIHIEGPFDFQELQRRCRLALEETTPTLPQNLSQALESPDYRALVLEHVSGIITYLRDTTLDHSVLGRGGRAQAVIHLHSCLEYDGIPLEERLDSHEWWCIRRQLQHFASLP